MIINQSEPCIARVCAIALRFLRMQSDVSADIEEMETECHDQASSSASTCSSAASAAVKESSELKQSSQAESEGASYTMRKLLRTKELRLPLIITVVLQVAQQLSGINAVSSILCYNVIYIAHSQSHKWL